MKTVRANILPMHTLQAVEAGRARQAGVQTRHVAIATSAAGDGVGCALGAVETHRTDPSYAGLSTC